MDRRTAVGMVAMGGLMLASGCDDDAIREHEFVQALRDDVKRVREAYDSLEGEVGEFETRNWQEVVPEVQSTLSNLEDAIKALEGRLDPTAG